MNKKQAIIKRPPMYLWMTEGGRALAELSCFFATKKKLSKGRQGDGHPVLVLPGFMASDTSTLLLRRFLTQIGYNTFGWELGRNKGQKDNDEKIVARLLEIHQQTNQKISIIGWSLGGIYGRQIAKLYPELTRQVITLGAPFSGIMAPNNASWFYNLIAEDKGMEDLDQEIVADLPNPTPVPSTAIYTKEDGIVSWKVCFEHELSPLRQNIQIRGSHIGLGVNPTALNIIADRLQYKKENWQKYKPKSRIEQLIFCPSF